MFTKKFKVEDILSHMKEIAKAGRRVKKVEGGLQG